MKHFKSLQKQEVLQLLMKGFIIYTLHKNAQIFTQIQGQLQEARFSPIWEDKALINGGLMGDIDLMGDLTLIDYIITEITVIVIDPTSVISIVITLIFQ